jgi:hypothetical protein
MFLHIGNSRVVYLKDIIGIFNLELKDSQVNNQFLESNIGTKISEREKENNSAFVITTQKIFYSPISSLTLQRRTEKIGNCRS